MDDLPIDIHYAKFGEWLVGQKKVRDAKTWQTDFSALRERVEDASNKIPDALPQLQALLRGPNTKGTVNKTPADYFTCHKVQQQLEEHLGDKAKNFLGMYKDDQLKEWASICSAYEKNNLYLAEASRNLERNVTYEIPALKSMASKNEKEAVDLTKKIASHERTIEHSSKRFAKACEQLGIDGNNDLRSELIGLTANLPKMLAEFIEAVKTEAIGESLDLYRSFTQHAVDASEGTINDGARMQTLEHVRQASDNMRAADANDEMDNEEAEGAAEIDWGAMLEMETALPTDDDNAGVQEDGADAVIIDWDAEEPVAANDEDLNNGAELEINWDFGDDMQAGDDDGSAAEVDWDLSISAEPTDDQAVIESVTGGSNVDANIKEEPPLDLTDKRSRAGLMDDLLELDGFLKGRVMEMKALEDEGAAMYFRMDDAADVVSKQSLDSVLALQDVVDRCIALLASPKLHELAMIKNGGRVLDRMVEGLEHQKAMGAKLQAAINRFRAKRTQLAHEAAQTREAQELLSTHTLGIKAAAEIAVSKLYKGRKMNLVGIGNDL